MSDEPVNQLQHFENRQAVLDYVFRELLATLQDDLSNNLEQGEEETAHDLRNTIHDIELIENQVRLIPEEVKQAYAECLKESEVTGEGLAGLVLSRPGILSHMYSILG